MESVFAKVIPAVHSCAFLSLIPSRGYGNFAY